MMMRRHTIMKRGTTGNRCNESEKPRGIAVKRETTMDRFDGNHGETESL